ncbi:MAG: aminotransferase class I/II-fold pyridoxal phosphate-dependent enzyme [Brevinematales bacterium]
MGLSSKEMDIRNIDSNKYTMADFADFESDDLFAVTEYFWEMVKDATDKKYFVYRNPVMSAPVAEFDVYDRYSDSVRKFLNFCAYNYLGYSYRPEVIKAVQETVAKYGTGAVSAPLFSGYYDITRKLEEAMAAFKKKEDVMIFPTGYASNLGVLSCLLKPGDVAVLDILSHASTYDGARLAGAEIKVFSHNSSKHLEKVLKSLGKKRVIVCLESVYSMDGDLADLPEITKVCKKYGAKVLLDEAHATLIFGENGRGVAEHLGVEDDIDITIGTFSKSFGAIGGFAAGNKKLINYMKMFARSYVFSCAMAPHTAAGILKVLELFQKDKTERDNLWKNTLYMHEKLKSYGLDIGDTKSQVIPVIAGSDMRRVTTRKISSTGAPI